MSEVAAIKRLIRSAGEWGARADQLAAAGKAKLAAQARAKAAERRASADRRLAELQQQEDE